MRKEVALVVIALLGVVREEKGGVDKFFCSYFFF